MFGVSSELASVMEFGFKTILASRHLLFCVAYVPESLNFIDAFHCYKHKCKVVSLNLAYGKYHTYGKYHMHTYMYKYTVSHKKRSQLIFLCNFVKNQRILTQFSLLDFTMNDACAGMNFTHLT